MGKEQKIYFRNGKEREKTSYSMLYLIRHDISWQNLVQRESDAEKRAGLLQQLPSYMDVPLLHFQGSPDLRTQAQKMAEKLRYVRKSNLYIFRSRMKRSEESLAVHLEEWNKVRSAEEKIKEEDIIVTPLLDEQHLGLGDPYWEKDPRFANLPAIARARLRGGEFGELVHGFDMGILRRKDLTSEQLADAHAMGLTDREIFGDSVNDMWRDWVGFLDTYGSEIFAQGNVTVALFHSNKMRIALAASENPSAYDVEVPGLIRNILRDKQLWNNSIFELQGRAYGNFSHGTLALQNHYRSDDL